MRIGFNALCAENRSGTGRYAVELLLALAELDETNAYEVCLHAESPLAERLRRFDNVRVDLAVDGGTARRLLFERFQLPRWIAARRLDVFHGPAFVLPPRTPGAAGVATVHDAVFKRFPETVPRLKRLHYRRAVARTIREAAMLLVDSESTARDVREFFGASPGRLRVVPLGVGARFFLEPPRTRLDALRERLRLPERFLLTVGTLEPRKNLGTLLEAYARLVAERDADAPALVVAGRRGWGEDDLERRAAALGLTGRVFAPGFVSDEELPALYRLAEVFVCVSRYEGFGLPVLEAMAAGTPVVASDVSSLPEVVGDAGRLVPPGDAETIAREIAALLDDAVERAALAKAASRRARRFTWRRAAEKTLEVYQQATG